ncbi:hypothetical protein [Halosolutus gelatinilyticus]|uniref:hypothetical protein n=1 Tax=Halosolutus gelatinilyticus TaxID=2931975 RepID=UPI001FF20EAD|nr:hypothetical protein [Halosolutus gelatinilyticus]
MSDETTPDDVDDVEPDENEEEQPDVSGGAIDLDAVKERIEEESEETTDDVDDVDQEASDDDALEDIAGGKTMGDHYVNGLCAVSNAAITKYGGDEAQGVDKELAHQLEIGDAMDEWISSKGVTEEIPPGQALIITTLMFLVAAIATNPAVIDALASEAAATANTSEGSAWWEWTDYRASRGNNSRNNSSERCSRERPATS